ncbi:MAG: anti-sigma F factor antagonist [Defluviitaleaceae bacterium]|nr:anti-sigma F factor antagonist [Defluviitaleaceae bacterium]
MGLQIDIQNRVLVANLSGEMDHHQTERMRAQIDAAFEKSSCRHILLNMAEITFMDSSGIGLIIGRYKNAEKRGGKLALAEMSDPIARLFEISGLAKIVLKTVTVTDALLVLGGTQNE